MGNNVLGGFCESNCNCSHNNAHLFFNQSDSRKSKSNGPINEIFKGEDLKISSLSNLPIKTLNIIRTRYESPDDFYEKLNLIGIGAYGKVYKVRHEITKEIRVMKIIPRNKVKLNYKGEEEIEKEINILKRISHPNIVKLYENFSDPHNIYLINEYCSEGDLSKYVIQFKKIPEFIVKILMHKVFSSINYLHSNGIIHGDIKLENILIDFSKNANEGNTKEQSFLNFLRGSIEKIKTNDFVNIYTEIYDQLNNFEIKLIDFGSSKEFSKNKIKFKDQIGSLFTSAPEVLVKNYNEKCDIWSCGVVMYMLLAGELPFQGATESEIYEKIIKGRFCFYNRLFNHISFEAKDLIKQCFQYSPENRISAKEALNHPFFNMKYPLEKLNAENLLIKTKEILSKLISFTKKSKFFQAVLAYLAHNFIKKEQIISLKDIFLSIDKDMDGKLSFEEVKKCLMKIGMKVSDVELKDIFKRIDFDNDCYIDYSEFLQATISLKDMFTEEHLKSAFKLFDTHSDGTVSVRELEEILGLRSKHDQSAIQELLKDINKTENDEFTFEEFKLCLLQYIEEIH